MYSHIQHKLEQALAGATVTIMDQSPAHVGHHAGGAHLSIEIAYGGFAKKSLLEQHQMIYTILEEEIKQEIHALQLKTKVKK